jgi:hypothetical protein
MLVDTGRAFLCSPMPPLGHIDWPAWLSCASIIPPECCLDMLREPEPYLSTAHAAAITVLRHKGYEARILQRHGQKVAEYLPPDMRFWQTIWIPKNRPGNSATRTIMARLMAKHTVYAQYCCEEHESLAEALWADNAVKFVPKTERTYDRYWRDISNTRWVQHGKMDMDQCIDYLNPEVFKSVFETESIAIKFVGDMLAETVKMASWD